MPLQAGFFYKSEILLKWTKEIEMFYLNTIEQLFLFVEQLYQLEVCLPYSRLLTGIPILVVLKNSFIHSSSWAERTLESNRGKSEFCPLYEGNKVKLMNIARNQKKWNTTCNKLHQNLLALKDCRVRIFSVWSPFLLLF